MNIAVRNELRFLLNGEVVHLTQVSPTLTLLDYLRLHRQMTGSKEGCAEGDCGACTVLVGRLSQSGLVYESVNACIRFVGSLDACHVVTVEHLAELNGRLHPIQQAMVDHHGSQCGFCTPGVVMSLYGLWLETPSSNAETIEKNLQGNLCRCTGYEAIMRAAEEMGQSSNSNDTLVVNHEGVRQKLSELRDGSRLVLSGTDGEIVVPASADDLANVLANSPDATIVAGSTDVGLWVTKHMRDISPAVFINNIPDLQMITEDATGITFGAGVTYSEAFEVIARTIPTMGDFWNRIGGQQVRNMGTVGGNIANGSPIGDTPPPLIALEATVTLQKGATQRTVPLEDFFIAYGKQDRQSGDFVASIHVPHLPDGDKFAAYKISKRRDEDISAVCGAFRIHVNPDGIVQSVRIAFGGMAATPKRAEAVEKILLGNAWDEEHVHRAMDAFSQDYTPLTDWRASSEYRMLAARNLLKRFFLETNGQSVQVLRHNKILAEA